MKILFVLENYYPHIGGVEIVFKTLSEGLIKKGHECSIITHRLKNTKEFEIINGVKIYRINCLHSRYWFTFLSIPKVLKLAKKADIIHTTTYNGSLPTKLASLIRKKPAIITVHEILGKNWKNFEMNFLSARLHQFLEWLIIKLNFNKYISVSKSTQKGVLAYNIPKDKSIVIYNAVDYNFWNPKKYSGQKIRKRLGINKKFVYLFYGRPGVSKGLEYLIRAVPIISKVIPNSMLLAIVSKDPAYLKRYNYILKLIKKLNIQNKVIMHDSVPYKKLPNYIKATDCVVVPSLTEGFGFTAAESCAMNKSIVASNTTSLPEVISGKYVLIKPKNPEAIAKGVEMVHNKKTIKTKLKKFLIKENIERYLNAYRRLVNKHTR